MKGQFTVEFIVALGVFLAIIVYSLFYATSMLPTFQSAHETSYLKSMAFQLSERLIFDEGVWSGAVPLRIGLSAGYYRLNATKMNYLDGYCNTNYDDTLKTLGIGKSNVKIVVSNGTANIVDCPRGVVITERGGFTMVETRRYAVSDANALLNMTIRMW